MKYSVGDIVRVVHFPENGNKEMFYVGAIGEVSYILSREEIGKVYKNQGICQAFQNITVTGSDFKRGKYDFSEYDLELIIKSDEIETLKVKNLI